MTSIYFVRHAKSDNSWKDDRTRPLTEEGKADSEKVTEFLKNISVDIFVASPYQRSIDTIAGSAAYKNMAIMPDERFRERQGGENGGSNEMIQKRWADFDFHEEGGESLGMVQSRNIEALVEVLSNHQGKNIVIGTHGTALSMILNKFNPDFNCDSFYGILNFMPYIIRLEFNGSEYIGQEAMLIVDKSL